MAGKALNGIGIVVPTGSGADVVSVKVPPVPVTSIAWTADEIALGYRKGPGNAPGNTHQYRPDW